MEKRGQITIYLIIGFVILITVMGVYYLRSGIIESQGGTKISEVSSIPKELESRKEEVKTCIDEYLEKTIYELALSGGITDTKVEKVDFSVYSVPVLMQNRRNLLPSKEQLTKNLSGLINNGIDSCTNEDVTIESASNKVELTNKNVKITVNGPITLKKGSINGEIESLSFDYNIRLLEVRNVVDLIIANQIKYYPQICLSCIARTAVSNNVVIERGNVDKTQIFLIRDNTNNELAYGYAVKYE